MEKIKSGKVDMKMTEKMDKKIKKEIISWQKFGDLCDELALKILKDYQPDIVIGIVKAGVFPGAVIASLFRRDFYTIKLSRRHDDRIIHARPILFVPITDSVYGKKVLLVDWITRTGETLRLAREEVENKQASEVRVSTLFVKPDGIKPDWYMHESDALIVCPWNKYVIEDEKLVPHPEYG